MKIKKNSFIYSIKNFEGTEINFETWEIVILFLLYFVIVIICSAFLYSAQFYFLLLPLHIKFSNLCLWF